MVAQVKKKLLDSNPIMVVAHKAEHIDLTDFEILPKYFQKSFLHLTGRGIKIGDS